MDSLFFQKEKIGLKLPALENKTIFYCVLNWGVGHATRSIPIIKNYLDQGNKVILFSDGEAENMLRNSFPILTIHTLPSYKIQYKSKNFLFLFIILQSFTRFWIIWREQLHMRRYQKQYQPDVVISDNRYGCYLKGLENYLISHQLKLVTDDVIERLSQKFVDILLKPFDELWIPDIESVKLSAAMTEVDISIPKRWIGFPDLKLAKEVNTETIELLVLLSGPEPRRTELEKKYLNVIESLPYQVVFIAGNFSQDYVLNETNNCIHHSRMKYEETLKYIARAERIVCRSGYSTLIDLYILEKEKIICVPTAGQPEQEYLAEYWSEKGWLKTVEENEVETELVEEINKLF
jgi:UDP-N-acetylglucosamine:LPS N-acetylglucosamine transferase